MIAHVIILLKITIISVRFRETFNKIFYNETLFKTIMILIMLNILCVTRFCLSEGYNCSRQMTDCITCSDGNGTICSQCKNTFTSCALNNPKGWIVCCLGKCVDSHIYNGKLLCDKCLDSFYGKNCDKQCIPNCKRCNKDTGACAECAEGLYGSLCCPAQCKDDSCNAENGHCNECEDGYHGLFCNTSCSQNCYRCNQNTGFCEKCHHGYFGQSCIVCPGNCRNSECDQTDGHCIIGCKDGFFGPKCSFRCSEGCTYLICHQQSGKCLNGCRNVIYGDTCENRCSSNCKNGLCNALTGECLSCNHGQYGLYCNIDCPTTCRDSACNQESGDCIFGCHRKETYGRKCGAQCPKKCRDMQCTENGMCFSCPDGFFGLDCTKRCPLHCFNSTCNRMDGICSLKCIPNFHGEYFD